MVLAKVILIGNALGLSRGLENKPLILPTLYKSVVFSLFVGVFAVLEHLVGGLLHGKGLAGGFQELRSTGQDELLARCLVTFFAFIPFFAFQELGQVLGEGKLGGLFFGREPWRNRAVKQGRRPFKNPPLESVRSVLADSPVRRCRLSNTL